jgi:tRNA pseudouridine38-40 synthase
MTEPDPAGQPDWRARATLEYDGTDFAGSQIQPGQRTVQGVVEAALRRLTTEERRIALAGRTDAGVHAQGQVASFWAPARFSPADLRRGLNALLPPDVAVVALEVAPAGFHARYSARGRHYAYQVWNGPVASPLRWATSWHVQTPLALEPMRLAAQALIGWHDFASFAGGGLGVPGSGTPGVNTWRQVRWVQLEVAEETAGGRLIRLEIEATAFLPQMVRNIAGALVAVGRGAWPVAMVGEILAAADRRRSAPTAPPQGVILMAVSYDANATAVESTTNMRTDRGELALVAGRYGDDGTAGEE